MYTPDMGFVFTIYIFGITIEHTGTMLRNLLIISFLWAILILVVSGVPGTSLPESRWFTIPHFDKIVHFLLYLPLGFSLVIEFDFAKSKRWNKAAPFLVILFITVYGGLIEIAQALIFINRSADVDDLLFDIIGGTVGILIYYFLLRKPIRNFFKKRIGS